MSRNTELIISLILLSVLAVSCQNSPLILSRMDSTEEFDSNRAYKDLKYQVSLGPRTIGSESHSKVVEWIENELSKNGWNTQEQSFNWNGHEINNVIGKRGNGSPWIILGAHYDSRLTADQDPILEYRDLPVPGANDGASGVAVLLEIARALPFNLEKQIWLVFFDAEDNSNIPGWEGIIGSRLFVQELRDKPDAVVILDMIGDKNLNIYKEKSSDPQIIEEIWSQAEELGYSNFLHEYKYRMIDDHTPFLQAEIPAAVLIDFDYPYWHTTEDTLDKISAESLMVTGKTVLKWLTDNP